MRSLVLAAAFLATCFANASAVRAEDKATTSELPAALQALNVQDSQVLTADEAQAVRGQYQQAFGVYSFVIATPHYQAAGSFEGYFNRANLLANPIVINFSVR